MLLIIKIISVWAEIDFNICLSVKMDENGEENDLELLTLTCSRHVLNPQEDLGRI